MQKINTYLKFIILIIILLIIFVISLIYYKNMKRITKDISNLNLQNINKLMIVAHPDDELLWGGSHLIEDDYLVVCITCGTQKKRTTEFIRIMNETQDKYLMLGYPETTNGERDNWDTSRQSLTDDLKKIINFKDWEIIVTHNPEGEYGHIHHKLTSEIVTNIINKKQNLYYFGHYYTKKNIAKYYDQMMPISNNNLSIKKNLLGLYKTQQFIQTTFDHIYAYEEWIKSEEWEPKE